MKPNISIDACATIMAELDSRSYHRSLVQDANNVVQKLLQPMALPWTHKVVPVARNIPCDIDEMIDVLTADDGGHTPFSNGNFGFGQFETGRLRSGESTIRLANSSENFCVTTRRSTDPGIMQFCTATLPSTLPPYNSEDLRVIRSPPLAGMKAFQADDSFIRGETTLRCFEAIQALKKQRTTRARRFITSYEVSVKVNSSSSRSSLLKGPFDGNEPDNETLPPYVLEALLPLEIERGRRMAKGKAKLTAEELGTYDIRYGVSDAETDKNSKRIPVGRTRLVWTSKTPSEQPQRSPFMSLVTLKQLENGTYKRPRNILLRIKVDGEVFCGGKVTGEQEYSGKPNTDESNLQTSLKCDQLIQSIIDRKIERIRYPRILAPMIDCIPDSTGNIHVICTSPGTIMASAVSPVLKLARERYNSCCTVCWRSTKGGLPVKECTGCGLLAHAQCCLSPWECKVLSTPNNHETKKEVLKCNVCSYLGQEAVPIPGSVTDMIPIKKIKRRSRLPNKLKNPDFESLASEKSSDSSELVNEGIKCAICLLSGGVMSRISVEGEPYWVHEVCRIWTRSDGVSESITQNQFCALCGANGGSNDELRVGKDEQDEKMTKRRYSPHCLVKCAAAGCHIFVHPMCALVSSLTSQSVSESNQGHTKAIQPNSIREAKKKDIELCSQHTLTFASVSGKISGMRCTLPVPVFFCGIHNPAREQSFYGLYPGGKVVDKNKILRIPSSR